MDRNPFIIISPGRSGSSYVAGQFAKGGVFGGVMRPGDQWNEDGYFENVRLHRLLRDVYGKDWINGKEPEEEDDWNLTVDCVMKMEGYKGGPWFFKCGAFYWRCFQSFDPVYIKVWRRRDLILSSFQRSNMLYRFNYKQIERIVDRQHDIMRRVPGVDIKIGP